MKRTLISAAIVAATAVPALAADSTLRAIEHFNESADTLSERILVGPKGPVLGTAVPADGQDAIAAAVRAHNASVESASERITSDTVTVFSGEPAYAAPIFEELRRADDSD